MYIPGRSSEHGYSTRVRPFPEIAQKQIVRWLAADAQRTRGMLTSSHPELVAALPSAKGHVSHSLRRLETQGLIMMTRTPGGKTDSVSLTAAGRQKALQLTGSDE